MNRDPEPPPRRHVPYAYAYRPRRSRKRGFRRVIRLLMLAATALWFATLTLLFWASDVRSDPAASLVAVVLVMVVPTGVYFVAVGILAVIYFATGGD